MNKITTTISEKDLGTGHVEKQVVSEFMKSIRELQSCETLDLKGPIEQYTKKLIP